MVDQSDDDKILNNLLTPCDSVGEILKVFIDHYKLYTFRPGPTTRGIIIKGLKDAVKMLKKF